ncbi:MAG: PAS domain S-box protein [Prolixibacteraceae bacterium]
MQKKHSVKKKTEEIVSRNHDERAEEALRESESKYRLLIEHSSDLIWNLDLQGVFTYASPSWERITGYAPSAVIGKSFGEIVRSDFFSSFPQLIQQIIQTQSAMYFHEYQVIHANNTWHWHAAAVSPVIGKKGELISVVGVSRDITEQKMAEETIRINETRLRRAELASKSGHWELHLHSGEIIASEGAVKVYGLRKEVLDFNEIRGIPLPQYRTLLDGALTDLIERGLPYDIEFKIRVAGTGEIKDIHSVAEFDSEKKIVFGIIQDITDRKRTEEALKKSETRLKELNATKDKFFSIIAHDLKSPFNSIGGFSDLLEEMAQKGDCEGIKVYTGLIRKSSMQVMNLLTNLLEWSRSQTGKMKFNPVFLGIRSLVDEVIELLNSAAQQKSITVQNELPPGLVIFADKAMLGTILRNLISNSVKFTKPGGRIIISAVQDIEWTTVTVKDNGIGIKQEVKEKLFRIDESYSTPGTDNEQGTGLGLILCKELAEKHGGTISVESEPGKGSTFYVIIPANRNFNTGNPT